MDAPLLPRRYYNLERSRRKDRHGEATARGMSAGYGALPRPAGRATDLLNYPLAGFSVFEMLPSKYVQGIIDQSHPEPRGQASVFLLTGGAEKMGSSSSFSDTQHDVAQIIGD